MNLEEAMFESQKKRDLFDQDTHILKDNDGKYFTVISMNLNIFLLNDSQKDKHIYYTAWNLKK